MIRTGLLPLLCAPLRPRKKFLVVAFALILIEALLAHGLCSHGTPYEIPDGVSLAVADCENYNGGANGELEIALGENSVVVFDGIFWAEEHMHALKVSGMAEGATKIKNGRIVIKNSRLQLSATGAMRGFAIEASTAIEGLSLEITNSTIVTASAGTQEHGIGYLKATTCTDVNITVVNSSVVHHDIVTGTVSQRVVLGWMEAGSPPSGIVTNHRYTVKDSTVSCIAGAGACSALGVMVDSSGGSPIADFAASLVAKASNSTVTASSGSNAAVALGIGITHSNDVAIQRLDLRVNITDASTVNAWSQAGLSFAVAAGIIATPTSNVLDTSTVVVGMRASVTGGSSVACACPTCRAVGAVALVLFVSTNIQWASATIPVWATADSTARIFDVTLRDANITAVSTTHAAAASIALTATQTAFAMQSVALDAVNTNVTALCSGGVSNAVALGVLLWGGSGGSVGATSVVITVRGSSLSASSNLHAVAGSMLLAGGSAGTPFPLAAFSHLHTAFTDATVNVSAGVTGYCVATGSLVLQSGAGMTTVIDSTLETDVIRTQTTSMTSCAFVAGGALFAKSSEAAAAITLSTGGTRSNISHSSFVSLAPNSDAVIGGGLVVDANGAADVTITGDIVAALGEATNVAIFRVTGRVFSIAGVFVTSSTGGVAFTGSAHAIHLSITGALTSAVTRATTADGAIAGVILYAGAAFAVVCSLESVALQVRAGAHVGIVQASSATHQKPRVIAGFSVRGTSNSITLAIAGRFSASHDGADGKRTELENARTGSALGGIAMYTDGAAASLSCGSVEISSAAAYDSQVVIEPNPSVQVIAVFGVVARSASGGGVVRLPNVSIHVASTHPSQRRSVQVNWFNESSCSALVIMGIFGAVQDTIIGPLQRPLANNTSDYVPAVVINSTSTDVWLSGSQFLCVACAALNTASASPVTAALRSVRITATNSKLVMLSSSESAFVGSVVAAHDLTSGVFSANVTDVEILSQRSTLQLEPYDLGGTRGQYAVASVYIAARRGRLALGFVGSVTVRITDGSAVLCDGKNTVAAASVFVAGGLAASEHRAIASDVTVHVEGNSSVFARASTLNNAAAGSLVANFLGSVAHVVVSSVVLIFDASTAHATAYEFNAAAAACIVHVLNGNLAADIRNVTVAIRGVAAPSSSPDASKPQFWAEAVTKGNAASAGGLIVVREGSATTFANVSLADIRTTVNTTALPLRAASTVLATSQLHAATAGVVIDTSTHTTITSQLELRRVTFAAFGDVQLNATAPGQASALGIAVFTTAVHALVVDDVAIRASEAVPPMTVENGNVTPPQFRAVASVSSASAAGLVLICREGSIASVDRVDIDLRNSTSVVSTENYAAAAGIFLRAFGLQGLNITTQAIHIEVDGGSAVAFAQYAGASAASLLVEMLYSATHKYADATVDNVRLHASNAATINASTISFRRAAALGVYVDIDSGSATGHLTARFADIAIDVVGQHTIVDGRSEKNIAAASVFVNVDQVPTTLTATNVALSARNGSAVKSATTGGQHSCALSLGFYGTGVISAVTFANATVLVDGLGTSVASTSSLKSAWAASVAFTAGATTSHTASAHMERVELRAANGASVDARSDSEVLALSAMAHTKSTSMAGLLMDSVAVRASGSGTKVRAEATHDASLPRVALAATLGLYTDGNLAIEGRDSGSSPAVINCRAIAIDRAEVTALVGSYALFAKSYIAAVSIVALCRLPRLEFWHLLVGVADGAVASATGVSGVFAAAIYGGTEDGSQSAPFSVRHSAVAVVDFGRAIATGQTRHVFAGSVGYIGEPANQRVNFENVSIAVVRRAEAFATLNPQSSSSRVAAASVFALSRTTGSFLNASGIRILVRNATALATDNGLITSNTGAAAASFVLFEGYFESLFDVRGIDITVEQAANVSAKTQRSCLAASVAALENDQASFWRDVRIAVSGGSIVDVTGGDRLTLAASLFAGVESAMTVHGFVVLLDHANATVQHRTTATYASVAGILSTTTESACNVTITGVRISLRHAVVMAAALTGRVGIGSIVLDLRTNRATVSDVTLHAHRSSLQVSADATSGYTNAVMGVAFGSSVGVRMPPVVSAVAIEISHSELRIYGGQSSAVTGIVSGGNQAGEKVLPTASHAHLCETTVTLAGTGALPSAVACAGDAYVAESARRGMSYQILGSHIVSGPADHVRCAAGIGLQEPLGTKATAIRSSLIRCNHVGYGGGDGIISAPTPFDDAPFISNETVYEHSTGFTSTASLFPLFNASNVTGPFPTWDREQCEAGPVPVPNVAVPATTWYPAVRLTVTGPGGALPTLPLDETPTKTGPSASTSASTTLTITTTTTAAAAATYSLSSTRSGTQTAVASESRTHTVPATFSHSRSQTMQPAATATGSPPPTAATTRTGTLAWFAAVSATTSTMMERSTTKTKAPTATVHVPQPTMTLPAPETTPATTLINVPPESTTATAAPNATVTGAPASTAPVSTTPAPPPAPPPTAMPLATISATAAAPETAPAAVPVAVQEAVGAAATTVTSIASVGSLGNPAVASQGGRLASLRATLACRADYADEDTAPPGPDPGTNPFDATVGAGGTVRDNARLHGGAVVFGLAATAGFALLTLVALAGGRHVFTARRAASAPAHDPTTAAASANANTTAAEEDAGALERKRGWGSALAWARWPGVTLFAAAYFAQPVVASSVVALAYAGEPGGGALAAAGVVGALAVAVPLLACAALYRRHFRSTFVAQSTADLADASTKPQGGAARLAGWLFASSTEWTEVAAVQHQRAAAAGGAAGLAATAPKLDQLRQLGIAFDPYTGGAPWFFLAEMLYNAAGGVAQGLAAATGCVWSAWVSAAVALVYLSAMLAVRPYSRRFDAGVQGALAGTQALAAVLAAVEITQDRDPSVPSEVRDAAEVCVLLSALIATVLGVFEVAKAVHSQLQVRLRKLRAGGAPGGGTVLGGTDAARLLLLDGGGMADVPDAALFDDAEEEDVAGEKQHNGDGGYGPPAAPPPPSAPRAEASSREAARPRNHSVFQPTATAIDAAERRRADALLDSLYGGLGAPAMEGARPLLDMALPRGRSSSGGGGQEDAPPFEPPSTASGGDPDLDALLDAANRPTDDGDDLLAELLGDVPANENERVLDLL